MIDSAHEVGTATGHRAARAALLTRLFAFLAETDIPYCVLGDVDDVPHAVESDVDMVVDRGALRGLEATLVRFCDEVGARLVQAIQHEQTAYFFVLAAEGHVTGPTFLQVDVCSDYLRSGKRFLRAEELLEGRRLATDAEGCSRGFYVASPSAGFIYYLVKKVDKQILNARHGAHLSAQWRRDPVGAAARMRRLWSESDVSLLAGAAETGRWRHVRAALPELQRRLRARVRTAPTTRLGEWRRIMRRGLHPTGLWVAFLGPDGSGKTTVIRRVSEELAPAFWQTDYMHLRPGLGETGDDGTPVEDPHGLPPRSPLAGMAKLGYYLLDYFLGYVLKVWPRLVRSTLLIFDRYYHDLLIDPRRYRYSGPVWFARAVGRLVPLPDVFIILDAPVSVLRARKQEVSAKETARQREAYRALAARLPGAHVVDTARPVDGVVAEVASLLVNHLARTTQRVR